MRWCKKISGSINIASISLVSVGVCVCVRLFVNSHSFRKCHKFSPDFCCASSVVFQTTHLSLYLCIISTFWRSLCFRFFFWFFVCLVFLELYFLYRINNKWTKNIIIITINNGKSQRYIDRREGGTYLPYVYIWNIIEFISLIKYYCCYRVTTPPPTTHHQVVLSFNFNAILMILFINAISRWGFVVPWWLDIRDFLRKLQELISEHSILILYAKNMWWLLGNNLENVISSPREVDMW